ncbi:MAG: hypothetical protein JO052_16475, partial [Bradyrhizobium sp.]|nr:hypothetical protein [Bradyrhizobium sp.]
MTFDIEQFVGDCHNSLADDVPQKAIRPVAKAMTTRLVLVTALSLAFLSQPTTPANGADAPPAWAYPMTPPGFKLPPDDGKLHHVPNSSAAFTTGQLQDRFFTKDWRPDDHPP